MRMGFSLGAVLAVVLAAAAPAMALQSMTLPQSGDPTTNVQDPNKQDQFSTGQNDSNSNSLGSFHFHVTSGSDWPGDADRFYRPQPSTPDAYGSANTPGSEFSNSGYLFPH